VIEINFFVVFFSGMVIGTSPCILLMLSVFGSSLILTEEKSKFLKISLGLLAGMIIAYIFISIIFVYLFQFFEALSYFKYLFAAILIFIGVWQIIECKLEKSRIFGTPEKVKTVLKDFINKNSGFYAFLVGIIFVLIKIPCFGSIYLSLIYDLYSNPLLVFYIITYLIGLIFPVVLILILIRLGLESDKINEFRLKYRTSLRLLSGGLLIVLALLLLFVL
jgi:cytochrome c biogenesis protein CcdA